MILVQIFVHTVLTTFGCTVTCKHPWPNFVMARHVAIPDIVDKRVKGEKWHQAQMLDYLHELVLMKDLHKEAMSLIYW
jgi:biotin synthase-related radical SAM superfamily protein